MKSIDITQMSTELLKSEMNCLLSIPIWCQFDMDYYTLLSDEFNSRIESQFKEAVEADDSTNPTQSTQSNGINGIDSMHPV